MKILVTGGAGFIGSCFVRHMLNTYPDYKIINLDALTYAGNIENLDDVKDNKNYKHWRAKILQIWRANFCSLRCLHVKN